MGSSGVAKARGRFHLCQIDASSFSRLNETPRGLMRRSSATTLTAVWRQLCAATGLCTARLPPDQALHSDAVTRARERTRWAPVATGGALQGEADMIAWSPPAVKIEAGVLLGGGTVLLAAYAPRRSVITNASLAALRLRRLPRCG